MSALKLNSQTPQNGGHVTIGTNHLDAHRSIGVETRLAELLTIDAVAQRLPSAVIPGLSPGRCQNRARMQSSAASGGIKQQQRSSHDLGHQHTATYTS